MVQNVSNQKLLKLLFDMKQEMSSYKKETNKKISNLENTISIQKKQLKEKDNEIKILKETIVTMKEEHNKTVGIMQKELYDLRQENKHLKKVIKDKDAEINRLNKKIDKLEKENTKLKNSLSKNSYNSSKPSSTDGFHKIVHSLRKKSSNPIGGQKNHIGSTLTEEKVKNIINSNADNIIVKKEILFVNKKKLDGTKKYKVDTELSVIVTEYNLIYDKNASKLSKELKNDVTYGNNLKSFITLLNVEHAISIQRTADIIKELTNNILNISTGTIQNFIYELKSKVNPAITNIKNFLLGSEVNHKDETMLFCNGIPRWFHVFCNEWATYYYYHKSRGNVADIEKGLLMIFTGTLVHDHMKGLYKFQSNDAECNAHILRYLNFAIENYNRKWAKDLFDLLLKIKKEIKEEMEKGNNSLLTESILKYEQEYSRIIEDGEKEFKNDNNPHKDYTGDDMKLLRRLKKYKENHLLFMYDFRVPFDNNLAERDLRMIKAKKKIAGGFRSDKGGEAYTDIKTYLSTMKKQNNNLYQSIRLAFEEKPILINM